MNIIINKNIVFWIVVLTTTNINSNANINIVIIIVLWIVVLLLLLSIRLVTISSNNQSITPLGGVGHSLSHFLFAVIIFTISNIIIIMIIIIIIINCGVLCFRILLIFSNRVLFVFVRPESWLEGPTDDYDDNDHDDDDHDDDNDNDDNDDDDDVILPGLICSYEA